MKLHLVYCIKPNFRAGNFKRGRSSLKQLMRRTNTPLSNLDEIAERLTSVSEAQDTDEGSSIFNLFNQNYRRVTFMCYFCMFAACMGSLGVFLDTSNDPQMLLVDNLWLSFFDMIGYLLVPLVLDTLGRVKGHTVCFVVFSSCLLATHCLKAYFDPTPTIRWTARILQKIGKVANATTFGGMFA